MLRFFLSVSTLLYCISTFAAESTVHVEIFEDIPNDAEWCSPPDSAPTTSYDQPAFAWNALPKKYIRGGLIDDRSNPFLLRATANITLPEGEYEILLRAKNLARLAVDGRVVVEQNKPVAKNKDSHEPTPDLLPAVRPGHRPPPSIHQEVTRTTNVEAGDHEFVLETLVGGPGLRTELGELCVAIAGSEDKLFQVLAPVAANRFPLTEDGWSEWHTAATRLVRDVEDQNRRILLEQDAAFWRERHELAKQHYAASPIAVPRVDDTTSVANAVDSFVVAKLDERSISPAALVDDLTYLRRVTLDTVGVNPTLSEIARFTDSGQANRRTTLVDRLLEDPRWADHWVPYWQDVLAENPNILKASLNNTGPFRWWIYESFLDNKPMDQFATDLIRMRGSKYDGGPAGFGLATQNDVPEANKALILSKAFLAANLHCARCHDSPTNDFTQKELFSIAAMLRRDALTLPKTSTVVLDEAGREPLIEVSLKPGDLILPHWPLKGLAPDELSANLLQDTSDSREWLAAIITSPRTERFAQVIVNRLWHRYLGRGLVDPIDDWYDASPSHPRLLAFLARELVTHEYDIKHVARLILNSQTYQREVLSVNSRESEEWFASATRRRMSAEQVFDSLFAITGKDTHAERLTMDPEGRRPISTFLNLDRPQRAWQFSSLSNERDRPALSLPIAQSANDVLKAFGWRESRQDPVTVRNDTITPLQPLVLANGTIGRRIVGLSDDHALTQLCLYDASLENIVDTIFLSFFTRYPEVGERQAVIELLDDGFEQRIVANAQPIQHTYAWQRHPVSWANHLHPKSSEIMMALEDRARKGDPPTLRLTRDWRERMEDVLWALANSPELVFVP